MRRALLGAIAFVVLAVAVQRGLLRDVDRSGLELVQSFARPWLDVAGSWITVLGQSEVTAGLAAGLAVARLRARRADFWVPLAIVLVVVIESACKLWIAQPLPPRPFERDLHIFPGIVPGFVHAFPSGHVARDAFLLAIVHGWPRAATIVAIVLVALSRVYLGEPWPSDVLGGLLLGNAVASLALAAARRR